MAPLDPSNTRRIKVNYQNAMNQHSFQMRCGDAVDVSDIDSSVIDFLSSLTGAFIASEITSVDEALTGSDIFNPLVGSTLPSFEFGGAATPTKENDATSFTFVGRTTGGRRVRVSLFGYPNSMSNFRLTEAEAAAVGTAANVLQDDADMWIAIDGLPAIWKRYADIKPNDHWVGKAR